MKDSKVIIGIKKDPKAPIFQVADHELVRNPFWLVPAVVRELG
jgi:electron transfer flavoprotein alpha subunit